MGDIGNELCGSRVQRKSPTAFVLRVVVADLELLSDDVLESSSATFDVGCHVRMSNCHARGMPSHDTKDSLDICFSPSVSSLAIGEVFIFDRKTTEVLGQTWFCPPGEDQMLVKCFKLQRNNGSFDSFGKILLELSCSRAAEQKEQKFVFSEFGSNFCP